VLYSRVLNMNLEEERELIRKIRGRDREALKRFFAYFYGRIFFIVKEKLGSKPGDREDCRDLSSQISWETIVNIQNGNYDEEKGRLGQYLYGIVNNSCKNYFKLKKKNPQVSFSDLLPAYAKDNSEQELEKDLSLITYQQKLVEEGEKEMRRVLEEAIQNLEEKYKKLIYLKYYQELSYEEISRKENIPVGKVKSRLFEARKKLEKIILKKLNNLSNFSSEEGNI
jgi:RNA polymerase sigma-70 factor (ECF subfamily)